MSGKRPLEGIRILDFSHAAAGPYATMILADLGADVVKIEKPGRGDGARYMGAPMLGPLESDYYVSVNRNKRDILLDLQAEAGRDTALALAEKCDVVIQNFRPGVMDRLGLGFDDIRQRRPGIVYCSISAFGTSGPMASRPANDIIMQSVSGIMGITGELGGGPVRVGAPICDFATGLYGVIGILGALRVRDDHPEGQHIELAMLDSTISLMANYVPSVVALGKKVPRLGRAHAQIVPYQAFECADSAYVMVGAFTQGFWRRLCGAVGHEEWISDPRFATNADRLASRDALVSQLEPIFKEKTRAEWLEVLAEADVPASPVLEIGEALTSEQAVNNGVVLEAGRDGQSCPTAASPIRSVAWHDREVTSPPRMGEHTQEILAELLDLDEGQIRQLLESGAAAGPEAETAR